MSNKCKNCNFYHETCEGIEESGYCPMTGEPYNESNSDTEFDDTEYVTLNEFADKLKSIETETDENKLMEYYDEPFYIEFAGMCIEIPFGPDTLSVVEKLIEVAKEY